MELAHYTTEIANIFRLNKDRYRAHELATPTLLAMGKDRQALYDVFRKSLLDSEFINKPRHYPTLAFDIYQDDNVGISGNCFMPLPDRSGDLSFQSIHHHGKLLLTTVAAFGPGYQSIVFKKGFTLDKTAETAVMEIEKDYRFEEGSIEFVGSHQPHVVFFPSDVSITFAMWAYESSKAATQKLKSNPVVRRFKEPIRKGLKLFGLLDKAGVNAVEYFDFYPEGNQIRALRNRLGFEAGSNENFLTNIFYILRKTGFDDLAFLEALRQNYPDHKVLVNLIDRYSAGESINDEFYDFHSNVPYVNLSKAKILEAISK